MEWKLFDSPNPTFATPEWYDDREAAHHIDELGGQAERIHRAALLLDILAATERQSDRLIHTVFDYGAGDGGFLSLIKDKYPRVSGFDMQPSNVRYANDYRGVDVRLTDGTLDPPIADVYVMTEVLEHLEDPHKTLREEVLCDYIIASCPWSETGDAHYEYHLWAWDMEGFKELFTSNGWLVVDHFIDGMSQFMVAVRSQYERT